MLFLFIITHCVHPPVAITTHSATSMSPELPSLTLEEFKNAIKDISQFELETKKQEQKHFIFKLIETNNELLNEIKKLKEKKDDATFEDKEDLIFFQETIMENKNYLLEQIARVESINNELVSRSLISEQDKKNDEDKLINDINSKDLEGNKKPEQEENALKEEEEEGIYL